MYTDNVELRRIWISDGKGTDGGTSTLTRCQGVNPSNYTEK